MRFLKKTREKRMCQTLFRMFILHVLNTRNLNWETFGLLKLSQVIFYEHANGIHNVSKFLLTFDLELL